jgi:hypothetical protein
MTIDAGLIQKNWPLSGIGALARRDELLAVLPA